MRYVLLLLFALLAGCSKSPSDEKPAPASTTTLRMDHVMLLEPEAMLVQRGVDSDSLAAAIKSATSAVIAHDASHAGVLPAELDVVLVARPSGVRVWLVGAAGDVTSPELASALAAIPKVTIREGNAGTVATLVRTSTKPAPRAPYLPNAWKAAAGAKGAEIDQVIDAVWPR